MKIQADDNPFYARYVDLRGRGAALRLVDFFDSHSHSRSSEASVHCRCSSRLVSAYLPAQVRAGLCYEMVYNQAVFDGLALQPVATQTFRGLWTHPLYCSSGTRLELNSRVPGVKSLNRDSSEATSGMQNEAHLSIDTTSSILQTPALCSNPQGYPEEAVWISWMQPT